MAIPVVFDVTHLILRVAQRGLTGTDRFQFDLLKHWMEVSPAQCIGVHFCTGLPLVLSSVEISRLISLFAAARGDELTPTADTAYLAVLDWLGSPPEGSRRIHGSKRSFARATRLRWMQTRLATTGTIATRANIPNGAAYISVAQPGIWQGRLSKWLTRRPDLKPVFMIHDLLPIDHPEFFPTGYPSIFNRLLTLADRQAAGILVSCDTVRVRLQHEFNLREMAPRPIFAAHLPPAAGFNSFATTDSFLQSQSYFVTCGTIEPRKNHLFLLTLWRHLNRILPRPPRLVMVGRRGWDSHHILNLLERSPSLQVGIIEISALSTPSLISLLSNANAALLPTFAEGYGLPLIEALSLGVPTVASDIPAFRENSQLCAILHDPLNSVAWEKSITTLSDRQSAESLAARALASSFQRRRWTSYLKELSDFLENI